MNPRWLFPETPPVHWTSKGVILIKTLSDRCPEWILNQKIVKEFEWSDSTLSKVKKPLLILDWIQENELGGSKEIRLNPHKKNEIELFLRRWGLLETGIFVRPHRIRFQCLTTHTPGSKEKAVERTTQLTHVQISSMNNNKKYIIPLSQGTVEFHDKGNKMTFYVKGFVLPLHESNYENLEKYILEISIYQLEEMKKELEPFFRFAKVKFTSAKVLEDLHLGILFKENVGKVLAFKKKLKEFGFKPDDSVPGCEEYESEGKLDKVLMRILPFLDNYFMNK